MSNPLLARFASRPSLVAPEMREWFEGCLAATASHPLAAQILEAAAYSEDGFWPAPDDWRAAYRPYVVRDGVLQIPVKGVLLHDFSFALGGWATGYVYIQRAFDRRMADPTVRGIALLCDSPGGHVAGNFDPVDRMFAARGQKPIRAFAHEAAYSAAYSIASAADQIVVSRTGGVGSIGVVAAHYDMSGAMEQAGVKVTFIYAGRHKVDGNAFEALPDDVKAQFQARIITSFLGWVNTNAANILGTSYWDSNGDYPAKITDGSHPNNAQALRAGYGNATPGAIPSNTVAPAISGTPQTGQTLTASTGTWTGSPLSYAYNFKAGGVSVQNGSSNAYVLQSGDVGQTITVTVTATNYFGAATATSAATAAVTSPANTLTARDGTAFTARDGSAFTARAA